MCKAKRGHWCSCCSAYPARRTIIRVYIYVVMRAMLDVVVGASRFRVFGGVLCIYVLAESRILVLYSSAQNTQSCVCVCVCSPLHVHDAWEYCVLSAAKLVSSYFGEGFRSARPTENPCVCIARSSVSRRLWIVSNQGNLQHTHTYENRANPQNVHQSIMMRHLRRRMCKHFIHFVHSMLSKKKTAAKLRQANFALSSAQ